MIGIDRDSKAQTMINFSENRGLSLVTSEEAKAKILFSFPKAPRGMSLGWLQTVVVRTSRNVTYFSLPGEAMDQKTRFDRFPLH